MPNRCARCDAFAGRGRELPVPGEWLSYLHRERDVPDPVGTLKMPLCTDCYAEVEAIQEEGDDAEEREELLEAIDTDRLVDEG